MSGELEAEVARLVELIRSRTGQAPDPGRVRALVDAVAPLLGDVEAWIEDAFSKGFQLGQAYGVGMVDGQHLLVDESPEQRAARAALAAENLRRIGDQNAGLHGRSAAGPLGRSSLQAVLQDPDVPSTDEGIDRG